MVQKTSQMIKKTKANSETGILAQLDCPTTGERTRVMAQDCMDIQIGQVIWWRCAACGGWHMNLEHKRDCSQSRSK